MVIQRRTANTPNKGVVKSQSYCRELHLDEFYHIGNRTEAHSTTQLSNTAINYGMA